MNNSLCFSYSLGSPKDCALFGGNGKTLKLKTAAKLNSKHTPIATVRDLYRMYATFLTWFSLQTTFKAEPDKPNVKFLVDKITRKNCVLIFQLNWSIYWLSEVTRYLWETLVEPSLIWYTVIAACNFGQNKKKINRYLSSSCSTISFPDEKIIWCMQ